MDVWSFYERFGSEDRSRLGERDRGVLAICDLCQEVNSGGFDSYLRFWGGDSAEEARDWGQRLLGERWHGMVTRAMSLVGPSYPASAVERAARLDAHDRDEALAQLDAEFFAIEREQDIYGALGASLDR